MFRKLYKLIRAAIKHENNNSNSDLKIRREAELKNLETILDCSKQKDSLLNKILVRSQIQKRLKKLLTNPETAGKHSLIS